MFFKNLLEGRNLALFSFCQDTLSSTGIIRTNKINRDFPELARRREKIIFPSIRRYLGSDNTNKQSPNFLTLLGGRNHFYHWTTTSIGLANAKLNHDFP